MSFKGGLKRAMGFLLVILAAISLYLLSTRYFRLKSGDSILLLTLISVIWYSWETHGMKDQLIRQNDLSKRPLVVLDYIPAYRTGAASAIFRLHNIGYGPALTISVWVSDIVGSDGAKRAKMCMWLLNFLEKNGSDEYEWVDPKEVYDAAISDDKYTYRIEYADLSGKGYFTTGKLGGYAVTISGTGEL